MSNIKQPFKPQPQTLAPRFVDKTHIQPKFTEDMTDAFILLQTNLIDNNFSNVLKILSDRNINLSIRNKNDDSLLHAVIADSTNTTDYDVNNPNLHNLYNAVHFLLDNNVSASSFNKQNITPLHLAAKYQYLAIIEELLLNHANVNALDSYKMNALHYAVKNNLTECKPSDIKKLAHSNIIPDKKPIDSTLKQFGIHIIEFLNKKRVSDIRHLKYLFENIDKIALSTFTPKEKSLEIDIIKSLASLYDTNVNDIVSKHINDTYKQLSDKLLNNKNTLEINDFYDEKNVLRNNDNLLENKDKFINNIANKTSIFAGIKSHIQDITAKINTNLQDLVKTQNIITKIVHYHNYITSHAPANLPITDVDFKALFQYPHTDLQIELPQIDTDAKMSHLIMSLVNIDFKNIPILLPDEPLDDHNRESYRQNKLKKKPIIPLGPTLDVKGNILIGDNYTFSGGAVANTNLIYFSHILLLVKFMLFYINNINNNIDICQEHLKNDYFVQYYDEFIALVLVDTLNLLQFTTCITQQKEIILTKTRNIIDKYKSIVNITNDQNYVNSYILYEMEKVAQQLTSFYSNFNDMFSLLQEIFTKLNNLTRSVNNIISLKLLKEYHSNYANSTISLNNVPDKLFKQIENIPEYSEYMDLYEGVELWNYDPAKNNLIKNIKKKIIDKYILKYTDSYTLNFYLDVNFFTKTPLNKTYHKIQPDNLNGQQLAIVPRVLITVDKNSKTGSIFTDDAILNNHGLNIGTSSVKLVDDIKINKDTMRTDAEIASNEPTYKWFALFDEELYNHLYLLKVQIAKAILDDYHKNKPKNLENLENILVENISISDNNLKNIVVDLAIIKLTEQILNYHFKTSLRKKTLFFYNNVLAKKIKNISNLGNFNVDLTLPPEIIDFNIDFSNIVNILLATDNDIADNVYLDVNDDNMQENKRQVNIAHNFTDNSGQKLCYQYNPKIIEVLYYSRCNINERDVLGNTPLSYAVDLNHISTIQALISNNAIVDSNSVKNNNGYTPFTKSLKRYQDHLKHFITNDKLDIEKFCLPYYQNVVKKITSEPKFKNNILAYLKNIFPMLLLLFNYDLYSSADTTIKNLLKTITKKSDINHIPIHEYSEDLNNSKLKAIQSLIKKGGLNEVTRTKLIKLQNAEKIKIQKDVTSTFKDLQKSVITSAVQLQKNILLRSDTHLYKDLWQRNITLIDNFTIPQNLHLAFVIHEYYSASNRSTINIKNLELIQSYYQTHLLNKIENYQMLSTNYKSDNTLLTNIIDLITFCISEYVFKNLIISIKKVLHTHILSFNDKPTLARNVLNYDKNDPTYKTSFSDYKIDSKNNSTIIDNIIKNIEKVINQSFVLKFIKISTVTYEEYDNRDDFKIDRFFEEILTHIKNNKDHPFDDNSPIIIDIRDNIIPYYHSVIANTSINLKQMVDNYLNYIIVQQKYLHTFLLLAKHITSN